ncbi:MAG: hypothetical protein HKN92_04910 [Chitinophagales bacterium]|nr:hypothetical protein [Chitinophagales bacterium]
MLTRLLWILILICSSQAISFAQTVDAFPGEPDKFVQAIQKYLEATKRDDCKQTANDFFKAYKGGDIDLHRLNKVNELCQLMIQKKLRAYPYFENYINIILVYENSGHDEAFFNNWHDILKEVFENQRKGDNKKFQTFLEFSNGLFSKNALYDSQAKSWIVTKPEFVLKYEDEKPYLVFENTSLLGITKGDSVYIHNTAGTYYPFDNKWKGSKGRAYWDRAGLDTSGVNCSFGKYRIDMTKLSYEVDTVKFNFKEFFEKPIIGAFEDKLIVDNIQSKTSYPRFESFNYNWEIDQLSENITYYGGFKLYGSRIYGIGSEKEKARIVFFNEKKVEILEARSEQFTFKRPVEISADEAEIVLKMGKDSLYHPSVNFTYRIPTKEVRLFKGEEGISKSNFYDSYHQQEIDADAIFWNLNENQIEVRMVEGAGQKAAVFESNNFFNAAKLREYHSVVPYDPLSVTKKYYEKYGSRKIDANALAKAMSPELSESQIRGLLYEMVEDGFIKYDDSKSLVTVKDKTINYVLANAKKIDYDNIRLKALSTKVNAVINLENFDIDLNGVSSVPISDTAFVYIFPREKKITVKKNRDMLFGGTIFAGRMDFFGNDFYFNYEPFTIDLGAVDSFIINIPDGDKLDEYGDPILKPINSQIENVVGLLEVDAPINKSGRGKLPQFPKLTSKEDAFIFYQYRNALGEVYMKENFYFMVDPFKLDSLRTFSPSVLNFSGKLKSAGIFPDIEETVMLQPDLSLGFVTSTPGTGLSLFGGKGKYTGEIRLNNFGLRGGGKVNYLTSEFNTKDIIFFPDSMNSNAIDFEMAKSLAASAQFPEVSGKNNYIHWEPYRDMMWVKIKDTPFDMYERQTSLDGNLLVTNKGLSGDGRLDWAEAALSSELFSFNADDLEADTSSLEIKAIEGDKVTFNTPNVNAKVDFKNRFGKFATNTKEVDTEFAYNQYKTAINEFDWDMDAKILNFRSPPGSKGAYFVSQHPAQGDLKFLGKRAMYDLTTSILTTEEVPYIYVADSKVIPGDGVVVIEPQAVMKTLENATIVADTLDGFHKINNATVDISARKTLKAKGDYTYKTLNTEGQNIFFDNVTVEKEVIQEKKDEVTHHHVVAYGSVPETFTLFPEFKFQGDIKLQSNNSLLNFKGFTKMNIDRGNLKSEWFSFQDEIDPDNLLIHYDKPKSPDGLPLYTGIMLSKRDTSGMYTTLMNSKNIRADVSVLEATGIVKYDPISKIYTFGDEKKINGEKTTGNYLTYNNTKGVVYGEGAVDPGLKFGAVDTRSSGNVINDLNKNSYEFELTIAMDLEFNKDFSELFAYYMFQDNIDMPDLDYSDPDIQNQLAEMIDEKKMTKLLEEIQTTGFFEKPKDIKEQILFTNIKFVYDPEMQVYRSKGSINVSFIGDQAIHKRLDGFIEMGFRRSSDYFNIYFETNLNDWFYISYKGNTVQVVSSYDDVNELIRSFDTDKRKVKKDDNRYYIWTFGSKNKMKSFVDRMKEFK